MLSLQLFDFEPLDHCWRVGCYAAHVAGLLGMGPEARKSVRWSGILHDLGKLDVPKRILMKPGPLTKPELEIMRRHPAAGSRRLAAVGFPHHVQMAVMTHHERWNGSGYPHGLRGDQIPLPGRILAVCDSFDAMTSHRPYQAAMSFKEAMEEIQRERGRLFDPEVADLFVSDLENVRAMSAALDCVDRSVSLAVEDGAKQRVSVGV